MWATGGGQLDVAHALAPNAREGDLDAALLADDALVLHALVLAAQALVILDRSEDAGAEQAVALRLEGPIVDRLGLFDLAVGPGENLLRAGDRDPDGVENRRRRGLGREDVHHVLIHRAVSCRRSRPLPSPQRGARSPENSCHSARIPEDPSRSAAAHQRVPGPLPSPFRASFGDPRTRRRITPPPGLRFRRLLACRDCRPVRR